MMIDILNVTWRDDEEDEFSIMQRTDGAYVVSCNGQGHLPVEDLAGLLRVLAGQYERQTDTK